MYFVENKVGFSEAGPNYKIKLTKILDYFQNTCIAQSEDVGGGVQFLHEKGFLWVLSSWQVVINRYPELGEKILVGTAPYEFKGFLGSRNFVMKTEDGEILAYANSIWSFIDSEKLTLARIPEDVMSVYKLEEKLDMEYAPRKIKLPDNMEAREPFKVKFHNLDPNGHVNNAQYVSMAEDMIPEGRSCKQVRAEYRVSAHEGDTIFPYVAYDTQNKIYTVSLANEEGKPYVCVEFAV